MEAWKTIVVISVMLCVMQTEAGGEGSATATKGAKPASAQKKAEAGDTLVVTARLIEIPGTFAPNDLYNYVYIMKYRIVKVERGSYAAKELLVGQYNPLIPRAKVKDAMDPMVDGTVEKFEVGAVHRLALITPIEKVWNDAVDDEYFDSELTKYYALKTDIAK